VPSSPPFSNLLKVKKRDRADCHVILEQLLCALPGHSVATTPLQLYGKKFMQSGFKSITLQFSYSFFNQTHFLILKQDNYHLENEFDSKNYRRTTNS
jgi:hypothetical protein